MMVNPGAGVEGWIDQARDYGFVIEGNAFPKGVDDLRPALELAARHQIKHLVVQGDMRPYNAQEAVPILVGWQALSREYGVPVLVALDAREAAARLEGHGLDMTAAAAAGLKAPRARRAGAAEGEGAGLEPWRRHEAALSRVDPSRSTSRTSTRVMTTSTTARPGFLPSFASSAMSRRHSSRTFSATAVPEIRVMAGG